MEGSESSAIFEAYRDKIRRHILHLVSDSDEADDLVQETFLRAHRKLDSLQNTAMLSVWLYRIATHVCYDSFRKSSRRPSAKSLESIPHEEVSPRAESDAPRLDLVIEQAEMSACVQEFLEQLSDSYRTVILLHDLDGMPNPEIAQFLGCSIDAVKIRLHRAREKLRASLKSGCEFSQDERGVFVCDRKSAKSGPES